MHIFYLYIIIIFVYLKFQYCHQMYFYMNIVVKYSSKHSASHAIYEWSDVICGRINQFSSCEWFKLILEKW